MSGSDISTFGLVDPFWEPKLYARKLAEMFNCPTFDSILLMNCLRDSEKVSWEKIVEYQNKIKPIVCIKYMFYLHFA